MGYKIIFEERGIVKQFHGVVTAREYEACAARISANDHFDRAHYFMEDFVEVTGHDLSLDAVRFSLIQYEIARRIYQKIYLAIVTTDKPLTDLVTEALRRDKHTDYPTQVFPTIQAAREWIATQHAHPDETAARGT